MNNIKVRFAPSPTGHMHIGNTRTALFNWLLAEKLGGRFMLRIDDTDRERSKPEYEDSLRESLVWLGLNWTEEARQSARLERYCEVVEKLKAQGRIYECWETPEELELMRKRLIARGLPPIYSRNASALSDDECAARRMRGCRPHYRFRLTAGEIRWHDLVRGEVKYDAAKLSDPIVIREDGSFLYHLPSVIDDVDFGITHIVRGEDHVSNTAVQIEMFAAIGGQIPQFAHLPLLTGKEGKLSKRLGSLGVRELREEGVEALAICSFLAKIGTSESITPFYSLKDLAASLDFGRLGRAQPKFDEEELRRFNQVYLHGLPYENVKDRVSVSETFWNAVRGNLTRVDDVKIWHGVCFEEVKPVLEDETLTAAAAALLPPEPWSADTWNMWIDAVKKQTGKKGKELFHPLRMALTGISDGPELKHLLPFIGREKACKRLNGISD